MKPFLGLVLAGCLAAPSVTLAASVALAQNDSTPARDGAVELRWAEIVQVIAGQRVTAVLSDGGRVTGDTVVVRDDALVLDVKRSTRSSVYPGGNAPIPRAAIVRLEVEKHTGAGRRLGTVLGVLAGVVMGGWVAGEAADSAGVGIPVFLAVASASTLGGYYAGKAVSKHVTVIKIVDAASDARAVPHGTPLSVAAEDLVDSVQHLDFRLGSGEGVWLTNAPKTGRARALDRAMMRTFTADATRFAVMPADPPESCAGRAAFVAPILAGRQEQNRP